MQQALLRRTNAAAQPPHLALNCPSRHTLWCSAQQLLLATEVAPEQLIRCNRVVVEAMARPKQEKQPARSESSGGKSPTSRSAGDATNASVTSDYTDELPKAKHEQHRLVKEIGGPKGPEPTRYGDWEKGGRCIDF